jgi:hypothetical protein
MSEVTPLPEPDGLGKTHRNGSYWDAYTVKQLQAYGAADYQRALEDAATELEGLLDQTGCSVSDLIRNLK